MTFGRSKVASAVSCRKGIGQLRPQIANGSRYHLPLSRFRQESVGMPGAFVGACHSGPDIALLALNPAGLKTWRSKDLGDRVLLAFSFHLGSRSRAMEAECIIFETQGKDMKATLALGLILIIAQAHACERSVPANLRTDCRTPFRAQIYDACMARFWRNARIYYASSPLSYFRLFDWPPLVLVEEACVDEAMGVLPR
jgi:hypothetical protein